MDPIVTVLRLGEIERPIGAYGIMLAVAIVVVTSLTVRAAARARIDGGATVALCGFCCAGAFIGSYVLHVLVDWVRTGSPLDAMTQPGLVFFGAPIGGAVAFYLAGGALDLPRGRLLDLAAPAVPAAHAMGRLGCFLAGCCYGRPWDGPWSVIYTHPIAPGAQPPVPRHPSPLYESAGLLLIALALACVPVSRAGRGRRVMVYLLAYGLLRVAVELTRGDAVRGVFLDGRISTSQIIGGVVAACALAGLVVTREPRPATSEAT